MCHVLRNDGSDKLTELKPNLFYLYSINRNHYPMKVGRKPECPEKTTDDELQKMPHTKARKFKAPTETRSRALALVAG